MKRPSSSAATAARPRLALLLLTVFFTSLLALAGQVIWLRKLTFLFGATAAVLGAALSVFLLGLALGALAAGRVADRSARPWRLLALLEIGLGVYCLVSMPVLAVLGKLAAVLIVMLLPALAIGAVFPLAVRIYGRDGRNGRLGHDLSLLCGMATLGAALGALLAGFWLVPELGLAASTWLLGAAAVGLGLVLLSAGSARRPEQPGEAAAAGDGDGAAVPLKPLLATLFLSGAAALLLETGWSRFFALLNGTHLYSASTVLAGFLIGTGAGSLLMARWIDRIRQPFAAAAALHAVTALGGLLVFRSQGVFTRSWLGIFHRAGGFDAFQLGVGVVILLIVLLATLAMGAGFPLVIRLATRAAAERGAAAGRAFFASSLGAVLGALLAEFALLPAWGFSGLMITALAAYALAAAVFLALAPGERRGIPVAVCAVLLGVALLLSPAVTTFHEPFQSLYGEGPRDQRLLEAVHGFYGQVAVARSGADLLLRSNGRTSASTAAQDNATRLLLGHLPMLFHPNPRRVLVIGLGGGITLRAVTHHPEAQSITVAEVDPRVVEMARRWFAPYNGRALEDPRVRMVSNDGRSYLDGTRETFDVIVSGPPEIWVAGASGLFTEELYRAAAAHLSAGGILCQRIPFSEMEREDFRTMLHTITLVFPNVTFWKVGADVILLASRQPFQIELEPTVARLRNAALGQDFSAIGITMRGVLQIMNTPVVRPEQVQAFLGDAQTVNVDDRPVLEFSTARNLFAMAKRVPVPARPAGQP